jgi:hypothetical protein
VVRLVQVSGKRHFFKVIIFIPKLIIFRRFGGVAHRDDYSLVCLDSLSHLGTRQLLMLRYSSLIRDVIFVIFIEAHSVRLFVLAT